MPSEEAFKLIETNNGYLMDGKYSGVAFIHWEKVIGYWGNEISKLLKHCIEFCSCKVWMFFYVDNF